MQDVYLDWISMAFDAYRFCSTWGSQVENFEYGSYRNSSLQHPPIFAELNVALYLRMKRTTYCRLKEVVSASCAGTMTIG